MYSVQCKLGTLGWELNKLISMTSGKIRRGIRLEINNLPWQFEARSKRDYFTSGLRERTGELRSSIHGFIERAGDGWKVGLRSDKPYAKIQELGGHTYPHTIRPRFKRALWWEGLEHPVAKVEHPGATINANAFMRRPIVTEAKLFKGRLLNYMVWGSSVRK